MTVETSSARELGLAMGLTPEEIDHIVVEMGREPNRVELAVFAGMWSEHCSYKSTRELLRTLPTDGDCVLAGPGAHAGTVDVGDGWALAFKIESHNHPSAVEPYQGAATGIGGILRDVVAQGARPVAVMDALCFGDPRTPRTRWLQDGVVAGIGGYGNSYGVPNVGGLTVFDARYEGNPLVNALAAGLVRHDAMRSAAANGPGNVLLIVGATTGRDGILGAAFASEELGDHGEHAARRSHVQVGDPFMGKKLMEAMLAFDRVVACQDLGACGIACATSEMAAAGGTGFDVDLESVPTREEGMEPFEILLSESQERFMLVVEPGELDAALAHFRSHGVHVAACGTVTDTGRLRVTHGGQIVVDLPAGLIADGAPAQRWPAAPIPEPSTAGAALPPAADLGAALLDLLSTPGVADISWLYERYDQTVGNRTVRGPGQGEAAVQRLPGSLRGYAISLVGDGPRCAADPYLGTQALLGEALRNLACSGAEAIAVTDGLNVGSPTDPVEFTRMERVIRGLGDGLRTLQLPVTGGNCSLYNESPSGAIPPTPMIGMVGVIDDVGAIPAATMQPDQSVILLGSPPTAPAHSAHATRLGAPGLAPAVDLAADVRLARFLRDQSSRFACAKDAGTGGLGVAIAKLALRSGVGARIDGEWGEWALFGEGSGCAWVTADPGEVPGLLAAASAAGLPAVEAGAVGGDRLVLGTAIDLPLSDLDSAWRRP